MAAFAQVTSPAGADDLLVIPIRQVTGGSEGAVLSVGSVAVPPDLVGQTCQIIGRTRNQISVHPGNDLLIVTAGQTFIVPDFEDVGFVVHEAGEVESLGATIDLQIRFGPDGRSSGGFSVSVDCEPDVTTTAPPESTTTTSPVTTEPPTTASVTTTTPVTAPPSTAPPATGPTTPGPTLPGPTTASTDVETNPPTGPTETTPTSPTDTPESTTAPTSAPPPAGPTAVSDNAALPVTGSQTGLLLGIGATLIAFGFLTRRLATQRS